MSFGSCWAKINRAKQHRDALERQIQETFAVRSNRPQLEVRFEPETREHVIYVNTIPNHGSFFDDVALTIGDIVHNLRSALDHLVYKLALQHRGGTLTPKEERDLQFPIADTAETFRKECNRRLQSIASTRRALIEQFQPYRGLDGRPDGWSGPYIHQLRLLQKLSNTDKHRMLNPVVAFPTRADIAGNIASLILEARLQGFFGGHRVTETEAEPMNLGAVVVRAHVPDRRLENEVQNAGYITPSLTFSERRALLPTLDRLTDFVSNIVRRFETTAPTGGIDPQPSAGA